MPALSADGYISCPDCHALYAYRGSKPDRDEIVCNDCPKGGDFGFLLDERISYAVYQGWESYRHYFDEDGNRPPA